MTDKLSDLLSTLGVQESDELFAIYNEEEYNQLIAAAEALEQRAEGYEDALGQIVEWSKAYRIDVFPEPDFKKAAELLKAGGMTLDAISASNMRHVVEGVGKIAKEALAEEA